MKFLPGVDPEYLHPALLAALYMGDECFKVELTGHTTVTPL